MRKVTITVDMEQLDREEAAALAEVSKWQAVLSKVRRKREFLALYENEASDSSQPANDFVLTPKPDNLASAMERIANASLVPLDKKDLKAQLIAAGHKNAAAQQFYITIKRLKDRGRIRVEADGRIWKATK